MANQDIISLDRDDYKDETHVYLRRFYQDRPNEELFVARVRYAKHRSRAQKYMRAVVKNFQLSTVTQEELDAFRVEYHRA